MTDSFAAVLMVGLWSVQEASPAARLSTSHQLARLVAVVCSMCKNSSIA